MDNLKPTKERSPLWTTVRRKHLKDEPNCQYCGGTDNLEVHHVKPYHLHPELELEQSNLITLCEEEGTLCHLKVGHLGNWRLVNVNVRLDCLSKTVQLTSSKQNDSRIVQNGTSKGSRPRAKRKKSTKDKAG
jgi:5-methylcytosine-specific restriction enzyme A